MVSSRRPLVEKLTVFWHDHFAKNDQETQFHIPGVWGDAYDRAMAAWDDVATSRPAAAGPAASFAAARMSKDVADRLKPYTTDDGNDPLTGTQVGAGQVIAALVAAVALASTPVGVAEREFRISLYRSSVLAGDVRFNITNFGEDTHNLVVRRRSGDVVSEEIRAGRRGELVVRLLRPSRYTLLCTVGDHAALGMKAKLRVKKIGRR